VVDTRSHQSGFTLVEVVVAVTLLVVGVLAVASTSAFITGMIGAGGTDGKAAALGRGVLESVLPTACEGEARGDTTIGALRVDWSVAPSANAAEVVAVVTAPSTDRPGDSLSTARACPG
jgi:prepilin-type N-terminal cleavage/methylation domain-containing protein